MQLYVRALRVPVMPVPLPKHIQEARLAGLMAPPLAEPKPVLKTQSQPAQTSGFAAKSEGFAREQSISATPRKPAYVPASPTFIGGHVLASGLDARVFLRYRDAAGAVTDSIFQIYQVRASWPQGIIEQLHGHCFKAGAFRVVPMRDVQALGDERTGHFIFDLDAFLLGTPVRPNPFGITLSPQGEYLRDPHLPLLTLPADWLEWQSLTNEAAQLASPSRLVHQGSARPRAAVGSRFLLRYLGSDASFSDRIIRVSAISVADDGLILSVAAHCERADATRMFRRERIVALGDATTGALHADIDAALRGAGVRLRPSGPVSPKDPPGRGALVAVHDAQQAFAAMPAAERLASATRPLDPPLPKEKRPRGRPRKNPALPKE